MTRLRVSWLLIIALLSACATNEHPNIDTTKPVSLSELLQMSDQEICLRARSREQIVVREAYTRGLSVFVCRHAENNWEDAWSAAPQSAAPHSICSNALVQRGDRFAWDMRRAQVPFVIEAKRRGFSIGFCEKATDWNRRKSG